MREHQLSPELPFDVGQSKGKHPVDKNWQIENQKILKVLAVSSIPLNCSQIKGETGIATSNLRRRLSHLCYQRLIKIAFEERHPVTGAAVSYYTPVRPNQPERGFS